MMAKEPVYICLEWKNKRKKSKKIWPKKVVLKLWASESDNIFSKKDEMQENKLTSIN